MQITYLCGAAYDYGSNFVIDFATELFWMISITQCV